jgi:D-sedoheptulose 7-phosphate isomerase
MLESTGTGASPGEDWAIDRIIAEVVEEHSFLLRRFFEKQSGDLIRVSQKVAEAFRAGRQVYFFGNGGSASDAQHLAAEFVGRFVADRIALPAIAFTADTSILTAVANDYGYDRVFARQVEAFGKKGDVAFGISTSGNSPSVVEGIRKARELGLTTVGLLGRDGGALKDLVDHALIVEGKKTARIQELHILIGHTMCQIVEAALFGRATR